MTDGPTVQRIAGQLGYLFEDRPELRAASDDELADLLDREDRAARARAEHPLATDERVAEAAAALARRVTAELVGEARRRLAPPD